MIVKVIKTANDAFYEGDVRKALTNYHIAETLYKDLGNTNGVGICNNNIGNLFMKEKRYDVAVKHCFY
jgi:hypothetical protein